jgi:Phosphotransferase enzyme family
MEATDLEPISLVRTSWKPLDVATCAAVDLAEDRTVIEKSIKQWAEYRREPSQAPFTKPGWLSELLAWAQQQLAPLGVRLTGSFAQLNASPRFSLIRLETDDASAVWFKATGEPNRHELPITCCIARFFPGHVPELLGVHAPWNGWLSREVPGSALHHETEPPSWLKAAEDLARLQIASVANQIELLAGGCRDLRLPRLIDEIDPFVERMCRLMASQEKERPARLTDTELGILRDSLQRACSRLSELGLPDTLGHLDFNPGNVVVSPERTVFLDWAEGCVTNPLITIEYLREHFQRTNNVQKTEALLAAYMRPWRNSISPDAFGKAMLLSPLVAVFAYAVGSHTWRSQEVLLKPSVAGYFRSLARRMYREAAHIAERREPCLA